jgi:hypothetical protein
MYYYQSFFLKLWIDSEDIRKQDQVRVSIYTVYMGSFAPIE